MECVYYNRNASHHGCEDACIGCKNDPQHRQITRDEFLDMWCSLRCKDCKFYKVDADRNESICKRIDHKHIQFAVPWFKSYDCDSGGICSDFEPSETKVWLYNHWKGYDFLYPCPPKETSTTALCLDRDQSVRYHVLTRDFQNNTFLDEQGNLKWVEKLYYKQSRSSPIGYVLCREFRSGEIVTTDCYDRKEKWMQI